MRKIWVFLCKLQVLKMRHYYCKISAEMSKILLHHARGLVSNHSPYRECNKNGVGCFIPWLLSTNHIYSINAHVVLAQAQQWALIISLDRYIKQYLNWSSSRKSASIYRYARFSKLLEKKG